jgi:type IV pilus assembly protein PilO
MKGLLKLWFLPFLVAGYLIYDDFSIWEQDVFLPLLAEVETEKTRLKGLEDAIQRVQEFEAKKGEKLAEITRLGEEFEAARKQFPSEPAMPELLRQLADVGERLNIEFASFQPQGAGPQDLVQSSKVRVVLRGSYIQIMSFLDSVAHMTRIVNTESLELKIGSDARTDRVQVEAGVSLLSYFLPGG